MSSPVLCTGRYAIKPYYMEKIGRRIYSVEELCYCIVQNAYMMDADSFDMGLVDWIGDELLLTKLSEELRTMLVHKCSAASFFGMIIDYVGYISKEEAEKTIATLRSNADMDVFEKRMARAEYLMSRGLIQQAFGEYEYLWQHMPEMDRNVKATIEHNEGVMYAHLFMYERAGELFLKAWEDSGDEESYMCYLASKRMSMTEQEYIAFVGEHKEARNMSLRLEQRMDEASDLYDASTMNIKLRSIELYRNGSKMSEYYDEVERLTEDMKAEYRELVKQ